MNQPTLTVAMPNYNHGRYLEQCIRSVASQSKKPDEFLILDDASTDNSMEIIETLAKEYSFIRVIKHEKNKGYFESLKEITNEIKTDYVHHISSDDYMLPGLYENAMQMVSSYPNAGIICGPYLIHDEDDNFISRTKSNKWSQNSYIDSKRFLDEFLNGDSPGKAFGISNIYKTEALNAVGNHHKELDSLWDSFIFRAIGMKYGVCYINQDCAVWRLLRTSMSQSALHDVNYMERLIDKMALLMKSNEFKDLFPQEYPDRWAKNYKSSVKRFNHPLLQTMIRLGRHALRIPVLNRVVPVVAELAQKQIHTKAN